MLDYDAGDYDFAGEAQAYREASNPVPAQLSPEMLGAEDRERLMAVRNMAYETWIRRSLDDRHTQSVMPLIQSNLKLPEPIAWLDRLLAD